MTTKLSRLAAAVALTLGLVAPIAPSATGAQQTGRVYRIGNLSTLGAPSANHAAFLEKLRELGWVEGTNITIEHRYAGRDRQRLRAFAAELAKLPVDLIFASGGAESAQAAKDATKTIPIVFTIADDPVMAGLVASLSRPEANVTGLSSMNAELDPKRLALLKEALPRLKQVGVLWSPADPSGTVMVRATESAARSLGVQLQVLEVRGPRDLGEVFAIAKKRGAAAVMVIGSPPLFEYQRRIAELAKRARLPVISSWRQLPESGGLMSYGTDLPEMFRRAAVFVDRILKGAKPADLPVERPTKFELVINLKAAKALGLTVPQSLLIQADQVID